MEKKQIGQKHYEAMYIAASFLFNAVIFLVCMFVMVPRALNNDDSIIHAITSSAYGQPSAVTVHTNIIFSLLLRLLQFLFSGVNWLAVIEVLSAYIAFSLMSSLILLKNPGWLGGALALFLSIVLAPTFYIGIHNTKLAPVIAVAGFAALLYGIRYKKNLFSVLGWVILLISSFLRLNAFLIGTAFAAGIGLVMLLRSSEDRVDDEEVIYLTDSKEIDSPAMEEIPEEPPEPVVTQDGDEDEAVAEPSKFVLWWQKKRTLIINFIILFAVVFGLAGLDVLLVSETPGGMEYREYNRARGAVSDFALPEYYEYAEQYRALGISENDYKLIEEWNFADLEKFDKETLSAIAAMRKPKGLGALFSSFFSELGASFTSPFFIFALVLTALSLIFSDKKGRLVAGWGLLAFFLCLFFMCAIGRTTHWVFSGLYGCLALTSLAAMDTRKKIPMPVKMVIPMVIAFSAMVLFPALYAREAGSYKESFNTAAGEIYTTLGEEHGENLYLFDHESYPANEIHRIIPTFSAIPEGYFKNSYSLGGWDTNSPAKNSILERYEVEGSPYRALLEKDNVFLIDTKNYQEKLEYIRENYDENATMSLYDVIGGYHVFAFSNSSTDFSEIETTGKLKILETAVSVDETFPDFLYIGVAVEGEPGPIDAAYVTLYNRIDNTERTYQGRVIQREDGGVSVVFSVLSADIENVDSYEVSVVFETNGKMIATETVKLAQ